jgi:alpha-glucosidase
VGAGSQEAYIWASVAEATRVVQNIRFQLLPYMYTLLNHAHTTGATFLRAMAWEFPQDPSLANADRQFFVGPAILVTPVLEQGATTVIGVFPGIGKGEVYYDWYTRTEVHAAAGENVTIAAPLGHIPVYIRGGHVIPTQPMAMTTRDARKLPWSVLVALGTEGTASGSLYLDDGESLVPSATLEVDVCSTALSFGHEPFPSHPSSPIPIPTSLTARSSPPRTARFTPPRAATSPSPTRSPT